MRNIHGIRLPKLASLSLTASLFLASCAKQEVVLPSVDSSVASSRAATYSDEQLVKGVFLFQGDIPAKLSLFQPYLAVTRKAEAANPKLALLRTQQADKVYEAMVSLDPTFPHAFKSAIMTRNFDEVQVMLQRGALLITSASLLDGSTQLKQRRREVLLKSIDLKKYDFKSAKGLSSFITDANKLAILSPKSKASSTDLLADPCLEFDIAVAVEVWEFVTLVNDVAAVTNFAVAFAIEWAWGVSAGLPETSTNTGVATNGSIAASGKDSMEKELFIKEVTLNLM